MLTPLESREYGTTLLTRAMPNGAAQPIPMPCSRRTANKVAGDEANAYRNIETAFRAYAMKYKRFFEKLSNAGPENGRMAKAVIANAQTTTPTVVASALSPRADRGIMVVANCVPIDWKKFTQSRATNDVLHMLSSLFLSFFTPEPVWRTDISNIPFHFGPRPHSCHMVSLNQQKTRP